MVSLLDSFNILSKHQYGFRAGHNTTSAIADFIGCVIDALDESQCTAGLLCDLANAFLLVSYKVLLKKLEHYKFSPKTLKWIHSYLFNRFQRTVINHDNNIFVSKWRVLKCGVPQGSILGPLLFLIYINDLPLNILYKIIPYADDTTAILRAKTQNESYMILLQILSDSSAWFSANGLKLNSTKTQIVVFKTSQNKQVFDYDLYLDGKKIKVCDSSKLLGIHVDKHVNWSPYIDILSSKLNSACFQMFTIHDSIDFPTKMMIYYALFFSRIQYGIECWGVSPGVISIFKIQKKYLRFMTFSNYKTSCRPLFKQHRILTVPSLYILMCLMFIKNNLNFILETQHSHTYETRNKSALQYPVHRLSLFEKTPHYMGQKLYNKIPRDWTKYSSFKFKRTIQNFLIDKAYYSMKEFLDDRL